MKNSFLAWICDADSEWRERLRSVGEGEGWRVECFGSSQQCFEASPSRAPHFIITEFFNFVEPDAPDGIELIHYLNLLHPGIIGVLHSSWANAPDKRAFINHPHFKEVYVVVKKPHDLESFKGMFQSFRNRLQQWR